MMACVGLQGFSQSRYWHPVAPSAALQLNKGKAFFSEGFQPAAYKLFTLDEPVFRGLIANAPYEKAVSVKNSSFFVTLPMADGTTQQFRLVEAPVMQPKLQAKYANIRSYLGVGVDNPGAVVRCTVSPLGFYASIRSANKPTVYINTINNDAHLYAVNERNSNDKSENVLNCTTDELTEETGKPSNQVTFEGNPNDGKMRVYQLALCSTSKFSSAQFNGSEVTTADSIVSVMSALNVYLARANLVYETDLGIRMVFVDNEDTLIYLNAATDPFTPSNLNSKCQETCDDRIGDANYDIGHVLHKGASNGNAGYIACVCKTGSKGSGFSTYSNPSLVDYLVIDYWTHEMGHQYGANHTFTYSNEGTLAQIEPGSGSTIMGYAGITGGNDVQKHSDDYFSTASLAQISNYTKSFFARCSVTTISGNTAPVANAGEDHVIPASTPFVLSGFGTDVDATDVLSYVWEQTDVRETGSTSIPKATNTTGPMFRSTLYSPNTSRSFPELASILTGANGSKWEVLPSVSREMNFRIVVRDNSPVGGNTASDNVLISVTNTAGPFKITAPNTNVSFPEGSTQTITWNVANTNVAPVNCTNVKISMSVDGGITFPYVLAASTANDGSEDVTVPLIPISTTAARIKIESVGNIFFDINDVNFSVDGTLPLTWLSFTAERSGTNNALLKWTTANEINNNHFDIERSTDGTSFNKVATMAAGKNSSAQQQYSYLDKLMPKGIYYYRIKQVDNDGHYTYSAQVRVTIDASGVSWSFVPNPAKDHITISIMTGVNPTAISISDASGKTVYANNNAAQLAAGSLDIPLHRFANGTYFIKVITAGGSNVQKLVVEK